MYTQIFDRFDASYGFDVYTGKNNNKLSETAGDWIKTQALSLWDMWVKQDVTFRIHNDPTLLITQQFQDLMFYNQACDDLESGKRDEKALSEYAVWFGSFNTDNIRNGHKFVPVRVKPTHTLANWAEKLHTHAPGSCGVEIEGSVHHASNAHNIAVPRRLLVSTARTPSETVDILTATGLESLQTTILLESVKCSVIPSLVPHISPNEPALHHDMFYLMLGVVCNDHARTQILERWPGWREMFELKDRGVLGSKKSIETFVRGKHNATRYQRFCVAWAWNSNLFGERVKLPKDPEYAQAADLVRNEWGDILQEPDATKKLTKLSDLMVRVRDILKENDPNANQPNSRAQPCASLNGQLSNNMYTNSHSGYREEDELYASPVTDTPKKDGTADYARVQSRVQTVEEAKYDREVYGRRPVGCFSPVAAYINTPRELIDEASAAAWMVKDPPPLEHGNTRGILDEGALHRFLQWGDHEIFDASPEAGAGEVAIGVLLDCSGSMSGPSIIEARQFLHAILEGCKAKPNVKIVAMGYTSATDFCEVLHVKSPQDVRYLKADSSTPTAAGIQCMSDYMNMHHASAAKGMIVLTDGSPNSTCFNYDHKAFVSDPNSDMRSGSFLWSSMSNTRRAAEECGFPVVGVGFGDAHAEDMHKVFGYGRVWLIKKVTDAVKIVCDVLKSATM